MNKLKNIKKNALLIEKLIKNDLKSRYSGSVFGIIWAFVQPLVTIMVFWYVFQIGFRNPPVNDIEFILWFIAGYIPWTFFNDTILSSTNVLYEYTYLVKKMKFQVWMLPIIKVFSALYIHLFFLFFILALYLLYGYPFQIAWLSIFYFTFATSVLLIGIAFIVSSFAVFLKDASQIIAIVLQIGFWLTPIFWADTAMNPVILKGLQLNPMYYIISGFRDALIHGIPFWKSNPMLGMLFWAVTVGIVLIGIYVYRKLKVHFADLL